MKLKISCSGTCEEHILINRQQHYNGNDKKKIAITNTFVFLFILSRALQELINKFFILFNIKCVKNLCKFKIAKNGKIFNIYK